jgi:hypothetical protein
MLTMLAINTGVEMVVYVFWHRFVSTSGADLWLVFCVKKGLGLL